MSEGLLKYHSSFVSCSGITTNVIITKLMLAGRGYVVSLDTHMHLANIFHTRVADCERCFYDRAHCFIQV